MSSLSDWNDTVHLLEVQDTPEARFYLLILDSKERTLRVEPFGGEDSDRSQKAYDKAEKDTERNPNTQVVLVSVDHVDVLRKAYPNYYVDTKGFISAVEREMNGK
jgi:putative GTP pyrophosphokinase